MTVIVFLVTLFACVLLSFPIAFSLFITGLALMYEQDYFQIAVVAQNIVLGADNPSLMAIPFFVLAGEFMNVGGLSKRIVKLPMLLLGHIKGGLGYVGIIAAMTMACLSGAAVADAAAVGALLLPMMREANYPGGRSAGLIAAAGIIAPIIPPSIPFIVFGVVSELSILRLFMAGIFPGLLMGFGLMTVWRYQTKRMNLPLLPKATRAEIWKTSKETFWALMLIVIIIGGFRTGIFTATEAGAVAAVYAMFVSLFVYKELSFKQVMPVLCTAAKMVSVVMLLFACAILAVWMIAFAQLPDQMVRLFEPLIPHPTLLMITMMCFVALVGMVMDVTPTILILTPVFMPLVYAAKIDPIYFGVVFIVNTAIGLLTPPVGNVLNVITGVSKLRFEEVVRGVFPYVILHFSILALLILFPKITVLWPLELLMWGR